MSGELPSANQQAASQAQSEAAHAGSDKQKEKARQLQSEADRAAVPKHGL